MRNPDSSDFHGTPAILFLSPQPFFEWRGSPIRVSNDLQILAELGYSVDFITFPIGEEKKIPGVNIYRIPNWFNLKSIPIGMSFKKFFLDFFLLFKAFHFCLEKKYDVIIGVEDAGVIAWMISGIRGSKLVYEKHSDPLSYRKAGHFFKNVILKCYAKVEQFVIRHADSVVVTGLGLEEQVRKIDAGQKIFTIFDPPSSGIESKKENVSAIRQKI